MYDFWYTAFKMQSSASSIESKSKISWLPLEHGASFIITQNIVRSKGETAVNCNEILPSQFHHQEMARIYFVLAVIFFMAETLTSTVPVSQSVSRVRALFDW